MKIWKRVIFGFIAVIILMIVIDIIALRNNVQIISEVNILKHSEGIELEQANTLIYLMQGSNVSLRELFLEIASKKNNNEVERIRSKVEDNMREILLAVKTLREATNYGYLHALNDADKRREMEEFARIDSLSILTSEYFSRMETVFRHIDEGQLNLAEGRFTEKVVPIAEEMKDLLFTISNNVRKEVSDSIDQLNVKVRDAISLGYIVSISGILLSLIIGLYISRSISKPLHQLISGIKMISKGNYKTVIDLKTKGELKVLADSFNSMAKELNITIETMRKYNAELEETNQTKDKFFSIIAHDLKNPFSVILGFAGLLVEQYQEFEEEERKTVIYDLNNACIRVYNLLENLLAWSRSQSGKIELYPEKLDINSVVEDCIYFFEANAEQKHITLRSNILEEIYIYVDKFTFIIVVNNILSNAIKFTSDQGAVVISAQKDKNWAEVTIQDSGIGMSKEIIDNLLYSDKIISTSGTQGENGTGLGLFLIRDFVRRNNGKLSISSIPDKGTEFKMTLPLFKN